MYGYTMVYSSVRRDNSRALASGLHVSAIQMDNHTMGGSKRGRGSGPPSPEKTQVGIGFLRRSGTDPLEKQLYPRSLIASRGVRTSLCESENLFLSLTIVFVIANSVDPDETLD